MKRNIVCLIIILSGVMFYSEVEANNFMQVHFIDVGQGDSIFIETPENKKILIDGGTRETGNDVVKYLKKQGVENLDIVIATHPHIDHIGGLLDVLQEFSVDLLIENGKIHWTRTFAAYRMLIHKENIPFQIINESTKLALEDGVGLQFLVPTVEATNHNQASLVTKLTYDEIDFLFLSDIEVEQEKNIAKKYDVKANILKIAHHGSKSSSSLSFLDQVAPDIALISYGRNNAYGHPVGNVINRLHKLQAAIYSTAMYGDIVIETDGKSYIVKPMSNPLERLAQ